MKLHHGDCIEVMATLPEASIDAIITDPPYDLGEPRSGSDQVSGRCFAPRSADAKAKRRGGFMGKAWDGTGIAFRRETWELAYRVAKPSAYLLAFGGTRTVHRMTCALEDAGWIIRDMLVWGYASGFPKSKASLKPAWEPIVMARKPGPLRMLAIDECRIPAEPYSYANGPKGNVDPTSIVLPRSEEPYYSDGGRWPANIMLTDPIFDGGIEGVVGGGESSGQPGGPGRQESYPAGVFGADRQGPLYFDGGGTYSRFFLIPKAARSDREPVLGGLAMREAAAYDHRPSGDMAERLNRVRPEVRRANVHPTVKPVDLMRHLVRLVTPTAGLVLDPFLGSGTTALACDLEGFEWIGIEKEAEYVAIAEARLNGTQRGLGLEVG